jgi:hypothetical protein
MGRVREDTGERLFNPARLTKSPRSTLRKSHFPDPPGTSVEHPPAPALDDIEGSQKRMLGSKFLALPVFVKTSKPIAS